uniref:FAS1 domain-containing protein n=1 Tax=Macrostomum lignano TaxID=282301 RepID=A0A1I8HT15_9PLAT
PPSHECQYLVKPSDAYSGRGGGSTDKFFLECCGGRQFPICGGLTASFQSDCCPGFARFENINGRSNCSQRLLADRELPDWLAQLPGSRVGGFSDAFASSPQVEGVLMTGRPNNGTWTLLALVDEAFDDNDFLAFTSCSNGTLSKAYRRQTTAAPGRAGMSAPKEKIAEGSRGHRSLIYQQKCGELEASNATGSLDFRLEAWKHLIPGRKYIADLQREAVVPSMFKMDSGESYPLKFSKYSNGVSCVECSPIVEANHEAGNAVVHFIGKSILSRSPAVTLGGLLESRFPDFWSLMPEPERQLLRQSSCDAFYTVLVPKQLDSLRALSGEQRSAALREHIVKGLWCTAGMIDRETQPVATVSTESVRFACSASSARQVLFGPNFSRRATVSSAAGEFDIMAVNGVLQVVDAPILPKDALSLRTALQLEEAEPPGEDSVASEPENLSAGLVRECFLNFQEGDGYIVLLPTDEAFRKFFTQRNIPEAVGFHDSAEIRCALLRHHVLAAGRGLTSLGRATHVQRVYRSLAGDLVADYLFVKNGVPKAFFMNAEVIHDTEGHAFENGHLYHVSEVLVPPGSPVWGRMVDDMYTEQKRVINRFQSLGRRHGNRLLTLFLPTNGYHALINLDTLRSHTADSVFYLAYLTEDGQSVDLTNLAGGRITVSREAGQYFAACGETAMRWKVPLRHCGVRLAAGIVCSVEEPLKAHGSAELGGALS